MKVCDLTQFYSPLSGGVKRYLEEKRRFAAGAGHQHILIIPGQRTETIEDTTAKTYLIRSPLVVRTSRYRALLNLNAVEEILEREKPDLIESGDPYQVAWKAIASGNALRIPVVGFYHSHFPEAYLRTTSKYLGATATKITMEIARKYVCSLYNHFDHTFVPSLGLTQLLTEWGVENIVLAELGVDIDSFCRAPDKFATRVKLGISTDRTLLLYVGRLAVEKNIKTLLQAFVHLSDWFPKRFHLLIVGDGSQREAVEQVRLRTGCVTWMRYCSDNAWLARVYRAADLFVHPGVHETFGLVALESQACGVPVVGIRGSYMDRIIFSDQSHWAPENSPKSLAIAIAEVCETNLEAAGIEASRRVANRYSWKTVFQHMFEIYEQTVAKSGTAI
jgi:alpha-1,6-mannosyltransferase